MRSDLVHSVQPLVIRCEPGAIRGTVRVCLEDEILVKMSQDTVLPLGDDIEMVVSGAGLESFELQGSVCRRIETRGGRLYGLAHDRAELRGHPNLDPKPDRRRWARLRAQERIPVLLCVADTEVAGALVDVSAGGIALTAAVNREGAIAEHEVATVSFVPPGSRTEVRRLCRIRSRLLGSEGIRYGLRFDVPDTSMQCEALWTCSRCGQKALLAGSQHHCPDCGRGRGMEGSYLPPWGRMVSVVGHRFSGNAQSCGACGSEWSGLAAHCGSCGASLT